MSVEFFNLTGKRALVTGAGRGIGRAIAMAYAEAGADVTLFARTANEIDEACRDIVSHGGSARSVTGDVTDIQAFGDTIRGMPPFDIFVNNAGMNRPMPLARVTEQDYDAVLNLNVKAALFAAQAVTSVMLEHSTKGSIINISSQMGHVGAANRSLYCASKWATEGFTKALAVELGGDGIRVNTLCPTFIETPMTSPFLSDPAFRNHVMSKIKLGRIGQVSDVTGAAIFLASDAAALMTGSALIIDGGWTAD
jgi:NAD(P)-dependent dehydrogenase (short-subunit alcohol dehydrogenase family)